MYDDLPEGFRWMTRDSSVSSDGFQIEYRREQVGVLDCAQLDRISNQTEEPNMNYEYKVICPAIQVDFNKMAADLSYKNPIALVEINTEKDSGLYVIIDYSILAKYTACTREHFDTSEWSLNINYVRKEVDTKEDFQTWIDFCSMVKAWEWPEELRDKGVVKVSVPKV